MPVGETVSCIKKEMKSVTSWSSVIDYLYDHVNLNTDYWFNEKLHSYVG